MNDWLDLVRDLRDARVSQGLSQRQVADLMGVGQPEISMWETGVHAPTLRTLCNWANVLGVKIEFNWRFGT